MKLLRLRQLKRLAQDQAVALQAPLSMEFSRQEYGVGGHSLLQEISPTQGLNSGLLHFRQIIYHVSPQGSPLMNFRGFKAQISLIAKFFLLSCKLH